MTDNPQTIEELQAEIERLKKVARLQNLEANANGTHHISDYIREPTGPNSLDGTPTFSHMTMCGLIVGQEYIATDTEETDCAKCLQTDFRRDEPGVPDFDSDQKEERYGD